ncbi:unnamed protein product [Rangifer tarandus platyrhynchus]|uniref:Uncharacterized protein n=1 Tax=Rangifer tarandus platyrhynchus TaxID=3082113 RepID=A0AC59YH05_RANTA
MLISPICKIFLTQSFHPEYLLSYVLFPLFFLLFCTANLLGSDFALSSMSSNVQPREQVNEYTSQTSQLLVHQHLLLPASASFPTSLWGHSASFSGNHLHFVNL